MQFAYAAQKKIIKKSLNLGNIIIYIIFLWKDRKRMDSDSIPNSLLFPYLIFISILRFEWNGVSSADINLNIKKDPATICIMMMRFGVRLAN